MKNADKYLILIVLGVIALIAIAFSVALLRPKPTYQPEDTPEGVANNYLFALQKSDFERAYGYLSPGIKHYPASVEIFIDDIHRDNWRFNLNDNQSPSIRVESARINKNRATVTVEKTSFYAGGLLQSSEYKSTFEMRLIQNTKDHNAWKIESSDDYWAWCWNYDDGCK